MSYIFTYTSVHLNMYMHKPYIHFCDEGTFWISHWQFIENLELTVFANCICSSHVWKCCVLLVGTQASSVLLPVLHPTSSNSNVKNKLDPQIYNGHFKTNWHKAIYNSLRKNNTPYILWEAKISKFSSRPTVNSI